ncbi:transketolase [Candidatus Kaiserbacteria bacterium RIFCSPHIGHO2_01_FULL_48_10]|uniref:Transketolase n=1 Tax=Candidatus Kaiserbacteria bacterium RIFCSPHIGHO2_01_FULL_48_10 TaxID=1798476 RepID=A0A1F6C3K8_9BACT|nr:MAG: transketolase [Candidatus Kaiserbacteria bacterium RIFCSPHIGHO2_01_FULL_48_10]
MLIPDAKLSSDIFSDKIAKASTRDGFGKGSVEAGKKDPRIVVLSADLAESTRAEWFKKEFPERFIEFGVAEQNMATVGAGLANYGKIPFITSYAAFSPGRNYEQIRTTIALNNVPVKVCGMHAGVSVGPDGATHQMLEDIALMRALPNMIVINPADSEEGRKATLAAAENGKPTYLRFGRDKVHVFTTAETPFEVGKAYYLWKPTEGKPDVAIIGCGHLLYEALLAAKALEEKGIQVSVINSHTVKPLDTETILEAAREAGAVVSVEEHQAAGGLGSALAELLAKELPTPMEFVAVQDRFGQSGEPQELIHHYGLDAEGIQAAVERLLKKK